METTDPGHSHGNQTGTILRQPVYDKPGKRSNSHKQHKTKSLVVIYWWHICHLGTRSGSLKLFLQQINLFHTTIKFTAGTSTKHVTFLDTTVILENDKLHTDLYTKLTGTHQYLSPNRCHPKQCTTPTPYNQCLRVDFVKRSNGLRNYLLAHGYETNQLTTKSREQPSYPVHKPYNPTHGNNKHAVCPW